MSDTESSSLSDRDSTVMDSGSSRTCKAPWATGATRSPTSGQLLPNRLASLTNMAVIWEDLYGCEEAAYSDAQEQKGINVALEAVFEPAQLQKNDPRLQNIADEAREVFYSGIRLKEADSNATWRSEVYQRLIENITGAVRPAHPWSLPVPHRCIQPDEPVELATQEILAISQFHPQGALQLPTVHPVIQDILRILTDEGAYWSKDATLARELINKVKTNLFPEMVDAFNTPGPGYAQFYTTAFAFIDELDLDGLGLNAGDARVFFALRRLNRFATTTLLRQLQAFDIRAPVFGVLLSYTHVAIHIDWVEDTPYEDTLCYSAFFPADDPISEYKIWDLRDPVDFCQVVLILRNLRIYTETDFAARVRDGLQHAAQTRILSRGDFSGWKRETKLVVCPMDIPAVERNIRHSSHVKNPVMAGDLEEPTWKGHDTNLPSPPFTPGQGDKHTDPL